MKVILLKDIKNIGKKNQIVEVNNGYATNYLLPNKLVVLATSKALDVNKDIKTQEQTKIAEDKAHFTSVKKQLEALTLAFSLKTNKDKVNNAISAKQICTALEQEHKITIDKHKFLNFKPINVLGKSEIAIKLYPNIIAKLKIEVTGV